ncbi:hypothetical protein [Streptomyces asoensis]|nr:hypothetical protein [Streptomyces asoensis]
MTPIAPDEAARSSVNLVRRHAPGAEIAFDTSGGDRVEAVERWR